VLTLDELIRQQPLIHNDRTTTWGIHPALAEFLDRHVEPDMVSLETGAGLSTLVILRKRPRLHVAVQPVADEFAAILEFARQHEIDTQGFRGVLARSQEYLPAAELPALDLVLIDGDHAFPTPFVDWYYTADKLKVGGLLIVDDIHIATGAILAGFMGADPNWEDVALEPGRFAIYRKRVERVHLGDWALQPYLRDAFPTAAVHVIPAVPAGPVSEDETYALEKELETTWKLLEEARMERDEARIEREEAKTERDDATATARQAVERIRAMESTKFWKLRRAWFRVRRFLALPGTE
jgi:hypothetical protein